MMLRDRFGVSERRACRVVGQHRSTQRLDSPEIIDNDRLLWRDEGLRVPTRKRKQPLRGIGAYGRGDVPDRAASSC